MPTYVYECDVHGRFDRWVSIHILSTEAECPECPLLCKKVFTPPHISVYATPNKGHAVRGADRREKQTDRDRTSYKALRKDGLQPRGINGSHLVEAMSKDRLEVEMGRKIPADKVNLAKETHQELKENQRKGTAVEKVRDLQKVPA